MGLPGQGYAFVLVQNLVTAGNWVFMNKVKGEIDISKLEMVYFNALGALPILMGPLYLSGELDSLAEYPRWKEPVFACVFAFICCCTLVYQAAAGECTARDWSRSRVTHFVSVGLCACVPYHQ